jgi:catechol 2,3-dioxygenase-like lactoylglutathione lyase family enzyme
VRILSVAVVVLTAFVLRPDSAHAQLYATGPVTNGHHHLNVSDFDAHRRFWVDTLGGTPGTFATGTPIVMFPNALIFMRDQAPNGSSIGSNVDHFGFSVPDLRTVVDRLVAAGYPMLTAEHSPPGSEVVDDIRVVPGGGPVSGIAYVLGPDDIKVEVLEMRAQEMPIVSHHIHFFGSEGEQMRDWYMNVFAAQPAAGAGFVVATLPGLSLNFTTTDSAMAATPGRVIDHIGFEVEDLKAFLDDLAAKGIEPTVSYREIPEANLAIAFIADPWGTSIELTQGLDAIR